MTNEEYFAYMDRPLDEHEKDVICKAGWVFHTDSYIYIPDDYDGAFADGIRQVRRVLLYLLAREQYIANQGNCKAVLEAMMENF